jgi:hypothetical protein
MVGQMVLIDVDGNVFIRVNCNLSIYNFICKMILGKFIYII